MGGCEALFWHIARRVSTGRPDDQVAKPVAIDVTGRGDRPARAVVYILTMNHKPPNASRNGGEIKRVWHG